jgi:hypothetical protein
MRRESYPIAEGLGTIRYFSMRETFESEVKVKADATTRQGRYLENNSSHAEMTLCLVFVDRFRLFLFSECHEASNLQIKLVVRFEYPRMPLPLSWNRTMPGIFESIQSV